MKHVFSPRVVRYFIPNIGTLVLMALLLFTYRASATPGSPPAAPDVTPGTISYQCMLTDVAGRPINGNANIIFRLYSVPAGGSALWTETHTSANAVPVSNGLCHVLLGSLRPIPTSVWSNADVYLGVQVGSDAEMAPREVISAVPYSFNGGQGSTTIPDGSITTPKLADGAVSTVKLADGVVTSNKIADGNVTSADLADSAVTSSKIADGNVNTSELADGGVTAAKLASGAVSVYNVGTGGQWSSPSCGGDFNADSGYQPVPGLSFTITVNRISTLLLDLAGLGKNDTAGRAVYSAFFVDGVRITTGGYTLLGGCRNSGDIAGPPWCTLSNSAAVTLSPGAHTIEGRIHCDAGTATVVSAWLRGIVVP